MLALKSEQNPERLPIALGFDFVELSLNVLRGAKPHSRDFVHRSDDISGLFIR